MATDRLGRPLTSLRISVTDRCNLRCEYCMPEQEYVWLPRGDVLSFEEIERLVDAFVDLGVRKLRLTGGEPLLRRDLHVLVGMLAAREEIEDVALTTNAVLLPETAGELRAAGLGRVTVSLDTLRRERFTALTRRDDLDRTLAGLRASVAAGFPSKINVVVMRGFNDDELVALLELGRELGVEVRFIEYMDVGGATQWSHGRVFPRAAILERLAAHYGSITPQERTDAAPAERFALPDGTRFGIIASTTQPFCATCDRARLTADGKLFLCLYASEGFDLRAPLRDGATRTELTQLIARIWRERGDRGAEARLAEKERAPLASSGDLRDDPHLEMHTRGG